MGRKKVNLIKFVNWRFFLKCIGDTVCKEINFIWSKDFQCNGKFFVIDKINYGFN